MKNYKNITPQLSEAKINEIVTKLSFEEEDNELTELTYQIKSII